MTKYNVNDENNVTNENNEKKTEYDEDIIIGQWWQRACHGMENRPKPQS